MRFAEVKLVSWWSERCFTAWKKAGSCSWGGRLVLGFDVR